MRVPLPLPRAMTEADAWPAWEARLDAGGLELSAYLSCMKDMQARLNAAFDEHMEASELVRARAAIVDRVLVKVWHTLELDAEPIALVAVGGYGRGDLHPGSDIDLLILLREPTGEPTEQLLTRFLTFLWDIGLEVGHSVRTLDECTEEARDDLTVITNLMEARLLTGPSTLLADMRRLTRPERMWDSRVFFNAKLEEQSQRHHKFGDTAYKVEPNLKDGPGGLRDIQTICWVTHRHYGTSSLKELSEHEFLNSQEYAALIEGQEFLWQVRYALHKLTNRKEDRLLFDYQRSLAEQFGYEDSERDLAVEQFMQHYYRRVMEIERLIEMLLQLLGEAILGPEEPPGSRPINRRFQSCCGYLEAVNPQVFSHYPAALLEVFLILEQHPELKGVSASTMRLIRSHLHLIDDRFRANLACRSLFMELLRQPQGVTRALRRMSRYGVLAAYLPSFGRIVGRMQYDLYHAYTVDEHTLFVIRNMRRLAVPQFADELPFCSKLFERLPKPELLYLSGLFHDIAKGRGGDHSTLGAVEAEAFCLQHGLSRRDSQLVAWLVRHHLVMSMTAQRKDISDPEVVREFARLVGSTSRLDYLFLLTVSDVRGTNPSLWNSWKNALLTELYQTTKRVLRRGLDEPMEKDELIREVQTEALQRLRSRSVDAARCRAVWETLGEDYFLRHSADEIAWHSVAMLAATDSHEPLALVRQVTARGGTEIFVHADFHPRLFALITSVLDQLGLDIVDARIITTKAHKALQTFLVLGPEGQPVTDPQLLDEIAQTLEKRLRAPEQVPGTVKLRTPRRLKQFEVPTRIGFSQDHEHRWTIMELSTADRPGLLSNVSRALADCGVDVLNARIATVSEQADDVFFVTDLEQRPITDQ
ncbi:MAG: [protein-PII] uridylyltransferase, partial [Chromatiales bacterium]